MPVAWPRVVAFAFGLLVGGCASDHSLRVTPARGGQAGGNLVRIEGDDFAGHGPLVVYFGDRAAKAVVVESRWLVTVVAPQSDVTGEVDVQLHWGDGTMRELPGAFVYDEQPAVLLQPEIGG